MRCQHRGSDSQGPLWIIAWSEEASAPVLVIVQLMPCCMMCNFLVPLRVSLPFSPSSFNVRFDHELRNDEGIFAALVK